MIETLTKKDFLIMIAESKKVIKHYYNYKQFEKLQHLTNTTNFNFDNAKKLLDQTESAQIEKHSNYIIVNNSRCELKTIKKIVFTSKENIRVYLILFNNNNSCLYITSV